MQEIMNVEDFFEIPNIGFVISGNGSRVAHLQVDEIEKMIALGIELSIAGKKYPLMVRNLDISTSLTGQININIAIDPLKKELEIERGAVVVARDT